MSNQEEINKRLSLPADLRLPDNFVETISPTLEGPLTRACRRQSLSDIGFGRIDTYTKLDKIGEVTVITIERLKGFRQVKNVLFIFRELTPQFSRVKVV